MKSSAAIHSTKTYRKQQDVPKTGGITRKDNVPMPCRSPNIPKRSPYSFPTRRRTSPVKKVDGNKVSRDQNSGKSTGTTNRTHSIGQAYKKQKEDVTKSCGKQTSPRKESIFVTPPRDPKDVAEDVIHADCMNHGYRVERTVGEGAYAKVKLAEVLTSKLARNLEMCEHVDNDGNCKVKINQIFYYNKSSRIHFSNINPSIVYSIKISAYYKYRVSYKYRTRTENGFKL